jgi:hypothetical protein
MTNPLNFTTATIANAGTTSGAIDLTVGSLCGIYLPATFTGTALSFTCSPTLTGTYQTWKDATGADIALVVAQGNNYKINPADFIGVKFLKLIASTQSQESIITVAVRDFQ